MGKKKTEDTLVTTKIALCPRCRGSGLCKAAQEKEEDFTIASADPNFTHVKCEYCGGTGVIRERY